MKRLAVDLVILNERPTSYAAGPAGALEALVRASQARRHRGHDDVRGSVFMCCAPICISARGHATCCDARRARRARQPARHARRAGRAGSRRPQSRRRPRRVEPPSATPAAPSPRARPELEFFNGLGGFAERRARVRHDPRRGPVDAGAVDQRRSRIPSFGFQVSSRGRRLHLVAATAARTSSRRGRTIPSAIRPGEAIYVRDEDSGDAVGPDGRCRSARRTGPTSARHGQGYSRFEHDVARHRARARCSSCRSTIRSRSRASRSHNHVAARAPSFGDGLRRMGARARRASSRAPFIVTEIDAETGAMFARNPWQREFGGRVAFADLGGRQTRWTGDRAEFLGRNGTLDAPAGAGARRSRSRTGRARASIRAARCRRNVELRPGERGRGRRSCSARPTTAGERATLIATLSRRPISTRVLRAVAQALGRRARRRCRSRRPTARSTSCSTAGCSTRRSPAASGRAPAFYQASGAYGFRDQLQDVHGAHRRRSPRSRASICCARRRGSSSRATCSTGGCRRSGPRRAHAHLRRPHLAAPTSPRTTSKSPAIARSLDEVVPFLEGPALARGRARRLLPARASPRTARRSSSTARAALDRSLAVGAHGLPLMGTGDWNDGMNRVGDDGQGRERLARLVPALRR